MYGEQKMHEKTFDPVRYPFSEIMVQGKVVGVIRDCLKYDG